MTTESTDQLGEQARMVLLIAEALSSRDAEIKQVLEGLAIRRHIDHKSWCWCKKRWDALKPHEPQCEAARALYAKLSNEPLPATSPAKPISKPLRRKSKKEQEVEALRASDLSGQLAERDNIDYGHHETLPRGEHVARIKRD